MGLKSDSWIRRMCQQNGMITPFVDGQVSGGVISYGVSSYGYDIRVSNEFKIFTNIHSKVVDPKNFDPQSFIDFTGDVCVIPPNSFVLAKTLEQFTIPKNVLVICLGKSTYARCFSGDTRVALADGTNPTLEEMSRRAQSGELFFGYGIDEHGEIIITSLENPRYIGQDCLLKITLDNSEEIYCTPDHQFIGRNGKLVTADSLRVDDALMPFDTSVYRGYTMIYHPLHGQMRPVHHLADNWNLRHGVYVAEPNTHRHHIDQNRSNNSPLNITRMDATAHIKYHNDNYYMSNDFDRVKHGNAIKKSISELSKNEEWLGRFSDSQRKKAIDYWHKDEYAGQRSSQIQKNIASWTEDRRNQVSVRVREYYQDPNNLLEKSAQSKRAWENSSQERRSKQQDIAREINIRHEITREAVENALLESGSVRGAATLLGCDRSVFRRFKDVVDNFQNSTHYRNHKVANVQPVRGYHDVYCLTVPETGNFALSSGVFVKNCGLIVNITPLEPSWRGVITLEISNTTPLPAKVYANEGIAQLLFLEGDEQCEVTYADRKGKYQNQEGIVTAKVKPHPSLNPVKV